MPTNHHEGLVGAMGLFYILVVVVVANCMHLSKLIELIC